MRVAFFPREQLNACMMKDELSVKIEYEMAPAEAKWGIQK